MVLERRSSAPPIRGDNLISPRVIFVDKLQDVVLFFFFPPILFCIAITNKKNHNCRRLINSWQLLQYADVNIEGKRWWTVHMVHILKFNPKCRQRGSKDPQLLPGEAQVWRNGRERDAGGPGRSCVEQTSETVIRSLFFFHKRLADYLRVSQRATIITELGFLDLSFEIESCQKKRKVCSVYVVSMDFLSRCAHVFLRLHMATLRSRYSHMDTLKKKKKKNSRQNGKAGLYTVQLVIHLFLSLCSGASYPITGSPSCTCLLI